MGNVARTLAALGAGLLLQRLAQLAALLLLARTLGAAATGVHAQGLAFGGLLAMLAGAGLRSEVARGIARQPQAAGAWLAAAARARLLRGGVLAAAAGAGAFAVTERPWFWTLSAVAALPAAFDLKQLGDAAARTRAEVATETASACAFLAAVFVWLACGGRDLTALAGINLGSRMLYAWFAARTIAGLPAAGPAPGPRELLARSRRLAPSQIAGELCVAADVCIVAWLAGDAAAGCYAVAARIAGAAGMPTAQLARLFFAHQLHAAHHGDAVRTTRVALRATALVLLPMLAGGLVVAAGLCRWFGESFTVAAASLRWLLLAIAAQHLGWQAHQALLAAGRDRAYAAALWVPASIHALALVVLAPRLGSTGGALAAALAQCAFAGCALHSLGREVLRPLAWIRAPLGLAIAVAAAALLAAATRWPSTGLQLAAGAATWCAGVYVLELRQRWRRLGEGLAEASGFRH